MARFEVLRIGALGAARFFEAACVSAERVLWCTLQRKGDPGAGGNVLAASTRTGMP